MKIIDLDLFNFEPIEVEGKGKKYKISMFPAKIELELLNSQEEISKKIGNVKNLSNEDLDKWKAMIGTILRNNNENYDETFHITLSPMACMGLMIAFMKMLPGRQEAIYQMFDLKEQENIKKKMTTLS